MWPQSKGRSPIETMLFLSFVNDLFINLFLEKHVSINRRNFEAISTFIGSRMRYFSDWRISNFEQCEPGQIISPKSFLSVQTWRALRFTISSFLHYSKALLEENPTIIYVPMLHTNTSTLESLFASIRSLNTFTKTGAEQYEVGIGTISLKYVEKALKHQKSYDESNCYEMRSPETLIYSKKTPTMFLS